jgi:peptidoglycan DL-endopeptidase CwlO
MRAPTLLVLAALLLGLLPAASIAVPAELERELDAAERQLASFDAQLSAAVEDYNEAAAELAALRDQLGATEQRVAALTSEVAELEASTSAFLRSLYMHGPGMDLELAFSSDAIIEAGRDLALLDRLSRQRQVELERLGVRRVELAEAQATLDEQVAAAAGREQRLAVDRDQVEQTLAGQRDQVSALQGRIAEIAAQEAAERARREEEARRRAAAEAAAQAASQAAAAAAAAAEEAARAAPPPAPAPPSAPAPAPPGTRRGADVAVQAALSQVGKPYKYGAEGPDSYDCSGLTLWAWRHAGVSLPHSSRMQYAQTTRISRDQLQPGDLIFFGSPIHHVAMYIGDGKVVEAPYTGANVRINDRSLSRSDIAGYGRV